MMGVGLAVLGGIYIKNMWINVQINNAFDEYANENDEYYRQQDAARTSRPKLISYEIASSSATFSNALEDNNIAEVTTDAKNIIKSNFPYGFFNNNPNEWGLINDSPDPVKVFIKFKKPVKIKSISSYFTHCPYQECNVWWASYKKIHNGKEISTNLVPTTSADSDFESKPSFDPFVDENQSFTEIEIGAQTNGPQDQLYWKKIKIEYQ